MADYLTDLKKKLSDALRDVAAKVKASPTGAAKSGAPTQSGPPVNITINVQPPKDSEDAAKTQDERVENVYLEREAAKAGFYGGSSYAKQVAARFRQAGYATPVGGVLAQGAHYASMAEHAYRGTSAGAAAAGVGGAINTAAIAVAVISQVLPMIREAIKKFEAETKISGFKAGLDALYSATAFQRYSTPEEKERALKMMQGKPPERRDILEELEKSVEAINNKIVQLAAGMEAVKSAALLALSLGDKSPSLQNADGFFGAGDYAGFKAAISGLYERKVKEKIGGGVYDLASSGVKEIVKAIEGSFK